MAASSRRDPTMPGLAGITESDLLALADGRLTATELATRLGVSRQAVSRELKKLRISAGPCRATGAAMPVSSAGAVPERVSVDAQELAISAAIALLVRAHGALAPEQPLAPSALKSLASTVLSAADLLRTLGVFSAGDEEPAALVVRVMTEKEEREVRAAAEFSR